MRMRPGTSASFAKRYRTSQNFLVSASTSLKNVRSAATEQPTLHHTMGPVLRIVAVNPPKKVVA